MGFALVVRELLSRKWLLLPGVLIAAIAAILSVYRVDASGLHSRGLQHSSATTQVLVDTPSSSLGDLSGSFESLNARATVFANFMTTPAVLELIGRQVGIAGDQIYAQGPLNANLSKIVQEPTALQRNIELTGEKDPYRLSFSSTPNLPTVGIDSQAPTTSQAIALANAAASGLQRYVAQLQKSAKVAAGSRVTIRQLGTANGSVDNAGISKTLAALVFVLVFLLWCVMLLVGARFLASWRRTGELLGGSPSSVGSPDDERLDESSTADVTAEFEQVTNGSRHADLHPDELPDPELLPGEASATSSSHSRVSW